MKNTKLILAFLLFILFNLNSFSQQFYLTGNMSYSIGMNGQKGWLSNYTRESVVDPANGIDHYSSSDEEVPLSLGKGFDLGVGVGYMFNDKIGVEIDLNYLIGAEVKSSSKSKRTYIYNNNVRVSDDYSNYDVSMKMWRVMPSLVLRPGFEKFNPFLKMGVVLGFGEMNWNELRVTKETNIGGTTEDKWGSKTVYSGGMSFGFHSALGVDFSLSEKLSLTTEVSYIGLSFVPKKAVVVERTQNGKDLLPDMEKYYIETEFVKKITVENTNTPNLDEPSKTLRISFPASSIGFKIGLKFNL